MKPFSSPEPVLAAFIAEVRRARAGQNVEAIHQARVAARRIDIWLALAGYRVFRDDLRWVIRGAGATRDLDVLIELPALPEALRREARRGCKEAHLDVLAVFNSTRIQNVVDGIGRLHVGAERDARRRLSDLRDEVDQRARSWERSSERKHASQRDQAHALRRALRRLRYGLDWFEPAPAAFSSMQSVFGHLADASMCVEWLDKQNQLASEKDRDRALHHRTKALKCARAQWAKHRRVCSRHTEGSDVVA